MDERLGSLARFAEVDGVHPRQELVIDQAWFDERGASGIVVEYRERSVILRKEGTPDWPSIMLQERQFLAVLVHLIRWGLLEDVGLVSRETGMDPRASGGDGARGRAIGGGDGQGRGQRLVTMVVEESQAHDDQEEEPDGTDPFDGEYDLVEGAGDPSWLELPTVLRYLHHDQELSRSDIAKLCDTTPAHVKGALARHGIEQRSQRGGRSKIAPASIAQ